MPSSNCHHRDTVDASVSTNCDVQNGPSNSTAKTQLFNSSPPNFRCCTCWLADTMATVLRYSTAWCGQETRHFVHERALFACCPHFSLPSACPEFVCSDRDYFLPNYLVIDRTQFPTTHVQQTRLHRFWQRFPNHPKRPSRTFRNEGVGKISLISFH